MAKILYVRNNDNTQWVEIASSIPDIPDISTFATIEYVDDEINNIDALPSQTGNNNKFLTTSGSVASWATVDLSSKLSISTASSTYLTQASASTQYEKNIQFSSSSPVGPTTGDLWIDSSQYSPLIKVWDTSEWKTLGSAPVPIITGISPDNISGTASTAVIINGSNFESGAVAKIIDSSNNEIFVLSTTFNNSKSIQILTPILTASAGPYDIKLTNPDNQYSILENSLNVGQSPAWSTPSGTLGNIYDIGRSSTTFTLLASDPDSQNISYELISGSLPTGMSLNYLGEISGTAQAVASDTTYSFIVRVKDSSNNYSDRSFSITTKAPVIVQFTSTGTSIWTAPSDLTKVRALLIAGGGGGGSHVAGGGGGGGVINLTNVPVTPSLSYSIVVGSGGAGGSSNTRGSNGGNSTGFNAVASGGGGGGTIGSGVESGSSGGSGGGVGGPSSSYGSSPVPGGSASGNLVGALNTGISYGNKGGNIVNQTRTGDPTCGSGGGGAGAAGIDSDGNVLSSDRRGGSGVLIDILQTSYYWAGGGGGGGYNAAIAGNGGIGGGGGGATTTLGSVGSGGESALNSGQNGLSGTGAKGGNGGLNTGGGGGGGSGGGPGIGGNGGSGIVIIKY